MAEEAQLAKLEQFVNLMIKWNKVYNLTALRDPRQMVTHHLLDSLAILPYLHGPRILDVGCGPGLPGIPLAIFRSDLAFTLLDSNQKKTRFVTQAAIELGLKHVQVVASRVEAYRPAQRFDTVVTRAFAATDKILDLTGELCATDGKFLLMKGVVPEQELAVLPNAYQLEQIAQLAVPGLEAQRHLVVLAHKEDK